MVVHVTYVLAVPKNPAATIIAAPFLDFPSGEGNTVLAIIDHAQNWVARQESHALTAIIDHTRRSPQINQTELPSYSHLG